MIVAFDTNILVYACDKRDPKRRDVARSVMAGYQEGVLLWQVACEFLAASRKLQDQGFTMADAWERLAELIDVLPLAIPSFDVLEQAYSLHTKHQVAFWDAVIFAACLAAGVQRIYSEDLPGCPITGLEVVNPFLSAATG